MSLKNEIKIDNTSYNKGPNRSSVINIVDRNLEDLLKEGSGFLETKKNLKLRTQKIKENLIRDMKTSEVLKNINVDLLLSSPEKWSLIESSRIKYYLYYITQCLKRIDDIDWCVRNRLRFYDYNSLQLFNLIKLKDKLLDNLETY
jgi:hypothetical protein